MARSGRVRELLKRIRGFGFVFEYVVWTRLVSQGPGPKLWQWGLFLDEDSVDSDVRLIRTSCWTEEVLSHFKFGPGVCWGR